MTKMGRMLALPKQLKNNDLGCKETKAFYAWGNFPILCKAVQGAKVDVAVAVAAFSRRQVANVNEPKDF